MKGRGVLLTLIATLWFTAATLLIKSLGTDVPTVWTAFLRNALALPALLLLLRSRGLSVSSPNQEKLILRAFWSVSAILFSFWALPRMPLANASLLMQTSPLFTVLWGVFFFRERLSRFSTACVALAFGGVYATLHPSFDQVALLPSLAALAAGLLGSLSFATLKSLTDEEPALRIVVYYTLVGTVLLAPWAFATGWAPSPAQLGVLAAIALTATVGQLFLTLGVEHTQVSRAGAASVLCLVLNVLGGWVFWNETPDLWTSVGCLSVAAGIAGLAQEL
ncbi:MAG TPA: hypothetical protein DCM05_01965 [Elusimicrobia bacterium]|nr:hypothetical protein [Elusimicrobiota bacterium]